MPRRFVIAFVAAGVSSTSLQADVRNGCFEATGSSEWRSWNPTYATITHGFNDINHCYVLNLQPPQCTAINAEQTDICVEAPVGGGATGWMTLTFEAKDGSNTPATVTIRNGLAPPHYADATVYIPQMPNTWT